MITLKEIYIIEKLENVSANKSFFWVSNPAEGSTKFEPGMQVPTFNGVRGMEEQEQLFDQVRKEKWPDRPSRLGSKLVFPSIYAAISWASDIWSEDNFNDVYQVEVTGKVFYTNMEYWTEADFKSKEARAYAEEYWKGDPSSMSKKRDASDMVEVLVDGSAKIIRHIDPNKVRLLHTKRWESKDNKKEKTHGIGEFDPFGTRGDVQFGPSTGGSGT